MDDGVKEDPAQSKEPKFLGKAGWVKKATGKMLAGYKDRFVHVEKTDIKVYENEDLKICLEKLDLENYDKCQELRSVFTKKNRLILIKTPKCGNKFHDVRFQAQTPEERDAWIKALREGINRAKNKILDEVKIDENLNLNHVTRTRPKVNHTRRPPTRIHMKEVANVSSEGILRLDLDLEHATIPNGAHHGDGVTTENSKEAIKTPSNATEAEEQSTASAEEPPNQKKVLKPPMPPSKAKPQSTSEEDPSGQVNGLEKGPAPPMPPSKDAKPSAQPAETSTEHASIENLSEKISPPVPQSKPLGNPTDKLAEASGSRPDPKPPTPPSKENKPSQSERRTEESNKRGDKKEVAWIVAEGEPSMTSKKTPPAVQEKPVSRGSTQSPESPSKESASSTADEAAKVEAQESTREKMAPVAPLQKASDTPDGSPRVEETLTPPVVSEAAIPAVVVTPSDPSTPPRQTHDESSERLEEKSVDSGQHSEDDDDDSEGSENGDALAASTAALRGSQAGLDVLDAGEEEAERPDNIEQGNNRGLSTETQAGDVGSKGRTTSIELRHHQASRPPIAAKPSPNGRSASMGDLLAETLDGVNVTPGDDWATLEKGVALELQQTGELLSSVSLGESMPEDLLAKAMAKLKMADRYLKEAKNFKESKLVKNTEKRNSL